MSNKIKAVFIIIAGLFLVGVGIIASYLLLMQFKPSAPTIAVDETIKSSVVVVSRDLSLGDRIATGDVQLASVPVEIVPRNAITQLDEAVGKITKTDLIQGEMLLTSNLADPTNNNKDLSFILSEDHVLLAFPGDDLMSRESIVQRGDIVDIFATFEQEVKKTGETTTTTTDEVEEPEKITYTIDSFQKVGVTALVLEVIEQEGNRSPITAEGNQPTPEPETKFKAYLLALDPQDALVLKHLKDIGAIFDIVVRAPTSSTQFDLSPVTAEYIIEFYGLDILP